MRRRRFWPYPSIVAFVSLAVVTGCGPGGKSSLQDPNVIRFAHSVTGGPQKDVYDEVCAEFEELNPGITVQQIAIDDEVYQDLGLLKLFTGGNPPDVYAQWGGWLVQRDFAANRAADLTDYFNQNGWKEEFYNHVWPWTEVDGRIYMVPASVDVTTVLWYNTELLRSLGGQLPATWEEFVDLCRKAKAAGKIPITAGNNDKWVLGNWGAHIVSRVAGEDLYARVLQLAPNAKFANPDFIRALRLLEQLAEEDFFNFGVIGLTGTEGEMPFRAGDALFHPIGSWIIDDWIGEVPDLEFDFINTPPISGGKGNQGSVLGLVSGFMIYKDSPRIDLTVEFMRYFMSAEVQRRFVGIGMFSSVKGAFEGDVEPHLARLRLLIDTAPVLVPPADTGFSTDVARHFYDAINSVIGGLSSAGDALERCDRRVERYRRRARITPSGGSAK
ncbi:MAG: ABC transporter substrate-binding protein [bacterium]